MSMAEYEPVLLTQTYNSYRDVPDLKEFIVEDVQKTGKRLGSGAFGVVEEVTFGGTLYAGKKLHAFLLDEQNDGIDRMIGRFISECKLMSRIRHPNIVQFMGLCFFRESIHPVLVMEKVDFSLEKIIENHKSLPLQVIIRILRDVIRGLIYLHCQKPPIIHRDLTARNVLVIKASMTAKIADLGNALMVDPKKLSTTLSQAPGTLPYMPPEALLSKPSYDCMLDMFSFGHLALYAIIQESPKDLLSPTYNDQSTDELKARSEVERRSQYTSKLFDKLTKDHLLTRMILQCLHNLPDRRLTATEIMAQLKEAYSVAEDPYDDINIIELISKHGVRGLDQSQTTESSTLRRRVYDFKAGAPGVIEIYRYHGRFAKRQDWRSQVFKIKDGYLKYFKINSYNEKEKPLDELQLSSVVRVKAIPPKENKSMFHFEIHFSGGKKGSPWLLRAYTQDDRACWMEAVEPGSSASIKPARSGSYEQITHSTEEEVESDPYSYIQHNRKEPTSPTPAIYDEPHAQVKHQAGPLPNTLAAAEYEKPIESANQTPSKEPPHSLLSQTPHTEGAAASVEDFTIGDDSDIEEVYDDIDLSGEDLYIDLSSEVHSPLQRRSTVPSQLQSVTEISLENVTSLDPKEAQLWMLLQMQKMIQKLEDVYDTPHPVTGSKQQNTEPQQSPHTSEDEKLYVNESAIMQTTRQDIYVNLDTISEVLTDTENTAPPIPPKTYKSRHGDKEGYRDRIKSEVPTTGKPSGSHDHDYHVSDKRIQRSKTLPKEGFWKSSEDKDNSPPKDRFPAGPIIAKQKMETSKEEMICTLKARARALSSGIASHLVTGDDDKNMYAPGKRPDWTKARTRSTGLEPTLAALHHKALFLPRSTLQNLKEIGHGQYGKVFHGLFKRTSGPGTPVAIKTIKHYESETERENFLKEMNVMSKLMHPNIVRLFGLVEQDEPWIVLEYLPHGDLKTFLTKHPQPVEKLSKYMLDVATGMHYISEKGLVHRDLAARNIMVSQDEICKVGDFGLLRELPKDVDIYVAKTKVAFPIRWMAPESLMKKEFSPASDVWSFGVVMWEMYNPKGKPYQGMTNMQVAVNVNQGLRLTIPEPYPPIVVSIMKACWQQSPSKRPSFLLIASLLTNVCYGAE